MQPAGEDKRSTSASPRIRVRCLHRRWRLLVHHPRLQQRHRPLCRPADGDRHLSDRRADLVDLRADPALGLRRRPARHSSAATIPASCCCRVRSSRSPSGRSFRTTIRPTSSATARRSRPIPDETEPHQQQGLRRNAHSRTATPASRSCASTRPATGTAAGAAVSCRITVTSAGTAAPTGPVRVNDVATVLGTDTRDPDPHRHTRRRGMGLRSGADRRAVVPDPRRGHDARNQPPLRRDGPVSDRIGRFENCARGNWGPAPGDDIVYPFGEACAQGGSRRIRVEKTGDLECRVGEPCTFEITITNDGTTGFSGPVRIGDAIGVDGLGRLEGVPISEIVPPFGCSPEPTTLPMSCVATLTLGAGEIRVHQVTVVIPDDGPLRQHHASPCRRRTASAWCRPTRRWPATDGADRRACDRATRDAAPSPATPSPSPKQVKEQCSAGFVMNDAGRCVCPEGTTFRNGQCVGGGEPPPPPIRRRRRKSASCCPARSGQRTGAASARAAPNW